MIDLERYTFVLLRRPADAPDYPEERLEEIQELHLAHLAAMRVFNTSLQETRELTKQDPAVIAGRLAADVMTWWTLPGSLPASVSS